MGWEGPTIQLMGREFASVMMSLEYSVTFIFSSFPRMVWGVSRPRMGALAFFVSPFSCWFPEGVDAPDDTAEGLLGASSKGPGRPHDRQKASSVALSEEF